MYRNAEGYPDPTAGEALANIEYEERKARRAAMRERWRNGSEPATRRWILAWPPQFSPVVVREVERNE